MLYVDDLAARYLERLFLELDAYGPRALDTIYVGGGTPTALADPLFDRLLVTLAPLLDEGGEFTVEANVESLSEEKLAIMRRHGVNRLSIGVQSFSNRLLAHMNRTHTGEDANMAVKRAKAAGFTNISVDLIYDLPTQTNAELTHDIQAALALAVPHISTYSLTVHPGTVYGLRGISAVPSDDSRTHYDMILERLRQAGYRRYEVSNFASDGQMGRHNLTYWNNRYYYVIGLGASGYLPGLRYRNTLNMTKYLAGTTIHEQETVGKKDEEAYFLMLKLRLDEGFSDEEFHASFLQPFLERYPKSVAKFEACGWLHHDMNRWYATDDGLMVLDQIIVALLEEAD